VGVVDGTNSVVPTLSLQALSHASIYIYTLGDRVWLHTQLQYSIKW